MLSSYFVFPLTKSVSICQTPQVVPRDHYLVENLSHHSYNLIYCLQSVTSCQCLTVELLRRTRKNHWYSVKRVHAGLSGCVHLPCVTVISFCPLFNVWGHLHSHKCRGCLVFNLLFYVFRSISAELLLLRFAEVQGCSAKLVPCGCPQKFCFGITSERLWGVATIVSCAVHTDGPRWHWQVIFLL